MPPENEDTGLLDAVNAAIESETHAPDPEPEEQEDEVEAGDADAGDDETVEDSDGEAEEGGEKDGDEEVAEEDAEPVAEEPKDEKPAEPKPEPEPKKELDPLNDPIPDYVKGRTRERIETLVGRVKEAEQYKSAYEEVTGIINSTGATPEEFGNMLNYMKLVHSSNPEDRRQALKAAQAELKALAVQLGETNVPGFDPIAEFSDLQNAVEAQEITPEHAREVAVLRLRKNDELARSTQHQQEQQAQMSAQEAVRQGTQALDALDARLRSDPQYAQKRQVLVPMLRDTFRQIHPSLWASTFETAFNNLTVPAAAPLPTPRAAPKQQPLRAKAPAGNSDRGVNSPLEAMNEALGSLGG